MGASKGNKWLVHFFVSYVPKYGFHFFAQAAGLRSCTGAACASLMQYGCAIATIMPSA